MQIKKEQCAGALYLGFQYSAGILPKSKPKERQERKNITTEAKAKINAVQRKYNLMLLVGENFEAGRDLFVYLGWAKEPTKAEDRAAMRTFHRRMAALYRSLDITYCYVDVAETHTREDEPCRMHHHLIISGNGKRMLGKILECWGQGSVDVRMLRELTDNFEDTCSYLLKEKKEKGKRAYNCSRNLRRPADPLRRKVPESAAGEVPPGVKIVTYNVSATEFGRYEIMVGKIIDQKSFSIYWDKIKRDKRKSDERKFWRSQARKKAQKKTREERLLSRRKTSLTIGHDASDGFGQ